MNKICTDIKQSKKLLKLGIDINTVDMYYSFDYNIEEYDEDAQIIPKSELGQHFSLFPEDIPAWSLTALLELMPKSICIKQSEYSGYFYFLEWQFANDNSLRYVGNDRKCLIDIYSDHDDNWKDSIDTAFEMVVWLKENRKI